MKLKNLIARNLKIIFILNQGANRKKEVPGMKREPTKTTKVFCAKPISLNCGSSINDMYVLLDLSYP